MWQDWYSTEIESGLIPEEERIYSTNQILEVMKKR